MTHLPSLTPGAVYRDVVAVYPTPLADLDLFTRRLLYGPSAFSLGERELLAAFVATLTGCSYCLMSHRPAAVAHEVEAERLMLIDEGPAALVDADPLKPVAVLIDAVVRGGMIDRALIDAVLQAGWDEAAVIQAVSLAGYWLMINRIVDGLGITADADYYDRIGAQLAREAREVAASFE